MGTTMKRLLTIFGFIIIAAFTAPFVHATEIPAFPSCLVPQGEVKVQYDNGIHGIAGDFGQYTGKDTVYNVSEDMVLQCFCPPEGQGIQTNWWMVGDMSYKEIEKFKEQGFVYVPTGSVYGLKNEAYLAKNVPFSCMGQPSEENQGGPGGGGSSSGGGGGSSSGGSSSGLSSSAPGLAPTGTLMSIFNTALIGALFVTGGFLVKKGNRS